jgi:hypothetical protein
VTPEACACVSLSPLEEPQARPSVESKSLSESRMIHIRRGHPTRRSLPVTVPPPQAELRPASASGPAGPGLVPFDSDGDSELLGRFRGPAWTGPECEPPAGAPGGAPPSPLSLPCDSQWWPRVYRLSDPGGCGSPPFDSGRATRSSLTWPARAHSRGVTSRWPPPPPDSSRNRSLRLSDCTGLVVKSSKMLGEPTAGEAEGTQKKLVSGHSGRCTGFCCHCKACLCCLYTACLVTCALDTPRALRRSLDPIVHFYLSWKGPPRMADHPQLFLLVASTTGGGR